LERLKNIIEKAEHFNINIAVENMSRHEYLEIIFSNIESKRLGFCYDSGHHILFNPNIDFLSLYGDKLMALHLHDNDGIDDWHALPFSGKINWKDIVFKLNNLSYNGGVALEVGNIKFEYVEKPDEFLKLAIESIENIKNKL
jgi:sugar phosphate isomerase/epimerase